MSEFKNRVVFVITPIEVEVEDCVATIYEVSKIDIMNKYLASVSVKCDDVVSNVFPVFYSSSKELIEKLKCEVSMFKYLLFLYGKEYVRRMGFARP